MPGSGLGLSIVRQVTERHSGTVRVEELPSGGTRMVMQLPGASLVAR
jgi:two-component system sensor histidine kinase MprB